MHAASGVGVRRGLLCAGHHRARPAPRPWARGPQTILAAAALPPAPATLPTLGGTPELRSLRSHVAMAMHDYNIIMAAACPPAAADIGRHRQQRGDIRHRTLTDGTSASLGSVPAGAK